MAIRPQLESADAMNSRHLTPAVIPLIGAAVAAIAFVAWAGWLHPANSQQPAPRGAQPAKALPADRSATMKSFDDVTRRALAGDYDAAQWHPIHFKPAIDSSKTADCLTCHQEVMSTRPRETSQAGQKGDDVLAWYQTLETYAGRQESFHWRHLQSLLAKQVMNLDCKFCHQGHDQREQSPHAKAPAAATTAAAGTANPPFTLRKRVNPTETCLKCHGSFPKETMDLPAPWHEIRADLEPEGTQNGCMTCHANIRTTRHKVNYLKPGEIEKAAKQSSDTCYGCHGGRAWYRISYPYPRNAWPDMPAETPDWVKDRPTKSDPRHTATGK
jgi:hypothetical protein